MTDEPDDRYLTAHHEAGHAVAALVCRGGKLIGITIDPPPEHPEYAGDTNVKVERPTDPHFVVYAGPWAEARSQWTRDSLNSLDDEDDDGRPFRCYVREAFDVINRDGDSVKYFELEEGILPDGKQFEPPAPLIARLQGAQQSRWSRTKVVAPS